MTRTKQTTEIAEPRSARSQRGKLRQRELEVRLGEIESTLEQDRKAVSEEEKLEKQFTKQLSQREDPQLLIALANVKEQLKRLRNYVEIRQDQRALVQGEIEALIPNAAQRQARDEAQKQLAQLTVDRLEVDRKAEEQSSALRRTLADRAVLSARMTEIAGSIEFSADEKQGLDAVRFDRLLDSLPGELAAESERWAKWFLGKREDVKPYIVRDDRLVVPETLTNHGIYRFGETIELTEEEAGELLREDRTVQVESTGVDLRVWDGVHHPTDAKRLAPSIMTVEAWQDAIAKAEKTGVPLEEYLFWDAVERGFEVLATPRAQVTVKAKLGEAGAIPHARGSYRNGDIFTVSAQAALAGIKSGCVTKPF